MKNFTFFSSFRGKKSHCTGKIRFYAQKMFNRKFEIFRTLSDEKKFTFWAITSVLVGIFQICLHIWKLEKKCNRMCVNRFFLSSRESGQNRTRRSKFWITTFRQPKVLKIGPPPQIPPSGQKFQKIIRPKVDNYKKTKSQEVWWGYDQHTRSQKKS